MAANSRSARYYRSNPEARAKKKKYDTVYHSTEKRKKYRRDLARKRRKLGIMGKGGKDISHKKGGGTTLESPSKNRARQGAGNKPKRK